MVWFFLIDRVCLRFISKNASIVTVCVYMCPMGCCLECVWSVSQCVWCQKRMLRSQLSPSTLLRLQVSCLCCGTYLRLASLWISGWFSCLCLPSQCRSPGIVDLHYYSLDFMWPLGIQTGPQACMANIAHWAVSLPRGGGFLWGPWGPSFGSQESAVWEEDLPEFSHLHLSSHIHNVYATPY